MVAAGRRTYRLCNPGCARSDVARVGARPRRRSECARSPVARAPDSDAPASTRARPPAGRVMDTIAWFADITLGDVEHVGGKGANLGELTRAGLPVPPGFVVTAEAYLDAMDHGGVRHDLVEIEADDRPRRRPRARDGMRARCKSWSRRPESAAALRQRDRATPTAARRRSSRRAVLGDRRRHRGTHRSPV